MKVARKAADRDCNGVTLRTGSIDMYGILKALHGAGFGGPIRPGHGRTIRGERAMPGCGLCDRALGARSLPGPWEAIEKSSETKSNLRAAPAARGGRT